MCCAPWWMTVYVKKLEHTVCVVCTMRVFISARLQGLEEENFLSLFLIVFSSSSSSFSPFSPIPNRLHALREIGSGLHHLLILQDDKYLFSFSATRHLDPPPRSASTGCPSLCSSSLDLGWRDNEILWSILERHVGYNIGGIERQPTHNYRRFVFVSIYLGRLFCQLSPQQFVV